MNQTIPTICGSVAGKPSALGVKLHDAGYKALGLEFKYIAIGTQNLEQIINCVRLLNFRGLGVSMPFKKAVIGYLDEVTPEVKVIGACNTILNENGRLIGYNTDWKGALMALEKIEGLSEESAVIIGSGGVARAIAYGLKQKKLKVFIAARSVENRKKLVSDLNLDGECSLSEQGKFGSLLVVNATPLADLSNTPVNLTAHPRSSLLLDVVFSPKRTQLVEAGEKLGWKVAPGWRMLLYQALYQFKLYTGREPAASEMERVLFDALP